jgi:hypothetical protein
LGFVSYNKEKVHLAKHSLNFYWHRHLYRKYYKYDRNVKCMYSITDIIKKINSYTLHWAKKSFELLLV